jgi:hypothetical protein
MITLPYLFAGFLVGLFITSVFNPVPTKRVLQPDVTRPNQILGHPTVENGCFKALAVEVACPATQDKLSLLA